MSCELPPLIKEMDEVVRYIQGACGENQAVIDKALALLQKHQATYMKLFGEHFSCVTKFIYSADYVWPDKSRLHGTMLLVKYGHRDEYISTGHAFMIVRDAATVKGIDFVEVPFS